MKIKREIKNSRGRIISFRCPRGSLLTPFFMPDATRGLVKLIENNALLSAGVGPMVVNTFHLYLQPGQEILKQAGGINAFVGWPWPLLSDSGGFQVFSLIHQGKDMGKILPDKAIFKSPLDGSWHELTPEKSIQIQFDLGVDMMVCLDDCPPYSHSKAEMEMAVQRTISWAKRCRQEYDRQIEARNLSNRKKPLLFAVVQGGLDLDLRKYCAQELAKFNFDGYGFGGRPVDENNNYLEEVLKITAEAIPENKLKFALGVGTPADIVRSFNLGWDMFDCVVPTREGRHGRVFVRNYEKLDLKKPESFYSNLNINNSCFAEDFSPINKRSRVLSLRWQSKAYLHHLFKIKEPLGAKLASLNNLEFYSNLMAELRKM